MFDCLYLIQLTASDPISFCPKVVVYDIAMGRRIYRAGAEKVANLRTQIWLWLGRDPQRRFLLPYEIPYIEKKQCWHHDHCLEQYRTG